MSYLEVSRYKKAWQIAQAEKVAVPGNQDYFVYLHIERDTDLPMYVGIGFRPNRPWDVTDRNVLHKNKIKKHGIRVEIIADGLSQESAFFWEVAWIKALRASGYSLANLVDGGSCPRGYRHTEQALQKLSSSNAGENNRMFGRRGDENPNFGRKNTEVTITRMQKAQKGRIISDSAKEKLRSANLGKKASAETKAKMSAARKGKPRLDLLGKKASAETKAKMSIARQGEKHPGAKKIVGLHDNKIFGSSVEAAKYYGVSQYGIRAVCRGEQIITGGYKFKYVEENA